jgi:excisionase family DNA binding protein
LLAGSIESVDCTDETVGGILIPKNTIGSSNRQTVLGSDPRLFSKAIGDISRGRPARSAAEAASYLNCSPISILRLVQQGQIEAVKKGNVWWVGETSLLKFKKS